MKHCLVTTDFSPCSEAAFPEARALQELFQCRLTLLAVLDPEQFQKTENTHSGATLQVVEESARKKLRHYRSHFFNDIPVETVVLSQSKGVSRDIVHYAMSHSVDTIVIATHGRQGLNRLLAGSVTERVLHTAQCPVLVVPFHESPLVPNHEGVQIVVTTDLSPASERALVLAKEFLGRYGSKDARLTVLSISENMTQATFQHSLGLNKEAILQDIDRETERRLKSLVGRYFQNTLTMYSVIRGDRPVYEELIAYGEAHDVDLFIMSSQGHSAIEHVLFGSVAEKMIRLSKRKVLIVPERHIPQGE